MEYLIHDIAKHHLVNKYGYPEDIASLVYDPRFPIRGKLCSCGVLRERDSVDNVAIRSAL